MSNAAKSFDVLEISVLPNYFDNYFYIFFNKIIFRSVSRVSKFSDLYLKYLNF